ncbi:Mu transposase domain-containing protein [Hespellia stercorisuis]|uniref:Transposase n=1 Tax=Hespellia stercorisuis DSM 15480 TaxID=1121950 RepID=A0A1M6RYG9_9FIRM|nr:transposase [Hespellia stercorisuis]SHK37516.1 Transposase [Hespellia stercorisuis DSM 15480]
MPDDITNYGIAELVYGSSPSSNGRDDSYELPDYSKVNSQMRTRKNMTLVYQWNRYKKECIADERKFYSYRQFCDRYSSWYDDNDESAHFTPIIGQTMEVDFAGKTFELTNRLTGEIIPIVVFVSLLPYSQYIYAEGMVSTKEPQWIQVNNNALAYFGGVTPLTICDNCKQTVITNIDWIQPELNKDYAEWADHNHTAILPAKVRKPKFKSSVENAVGILEKGFFHDMEECPYFNIEQFNAELWENVAKLNQEPFKNKEHNRCYYWEEEKTELMPLPPIPYEYMERKEAKVSSDFHVRFDNAYYSVDKAFKHQKISVSATSSKVRIFSKNGEFICEHQRAVHKGQWCTNPEHLPKDYNGYREWNAEYFIRKAMTIGPHTVDVIKYVLACHKLEVQTYRMCLGILNYSQKYGKEALEECCRQALSVNKVTYTYIKNSIPAIAEEFTSPETKAKINEERNKGAYVMDASAIDINKLLSKSQDLARTVGKEGK